MRRGARKHRIFSGGEDLAAVPSIGRANRVEGASPPEADATRALYERYANQIFRYCVHQLGSREEAEDAVQSTFLNAFRGLKRGVVPELESAWLFKIAHNVCLSRRRSSWRRGRVESPADFELVEELTPAPSRRADELIGLQDALEQMPETQRRAILLREWQGLSYREIGAELGLSQAAVETLIFRARRALASGLEQPRERRSAARMLDWGNAVTVLKSLLVGGSAATKVAATVAVVSATTVVAAAPVVSYRAHHPSTRTPARHAPVPTGRTPQAPPAARTAAPAAAPEQLTVPKAVRHARPAGRAAAHAGLPRAGLPHAGLPQAESAHAGHAFGLSLRPAPDEPAAPVSGGEAPRAGRGEGRDAKSGSGHGNGRGREHGDAPPADDALQGTPSPLPAEPVRGGGTDGSQSPPGGSANGSATDHGSKSDSGSRRGQAADGASTPAPDPQATTGAQATTDGSSADGSNAGAPKAEHRRNGSDG